MNALYARRRPGTLTAMSTSRSQPQEHPASGRRLITVAEAGFRLGMGRTTVLALARSGVLTSVKIGSARRIVADSVDTYIDELIETVAGCEEARSGSTPSGRT